MIKALTFLGVFQVLGGYQSKFGQQGMINFFFQVAGRRVCFWGRYFVRTIDLWTVLTGDFIKVDQIVYSKQVQFVTVTSPLEMFLNTARGSWERLTFLTRALSSVGGTCPDFCSSCVQPGWSFNHLKEQMSLQGSEF